MKPVVTLTKEEERDEVIKVLDNWSSTRNPTMFAVYYKGKQITISKRRVYLKEGTARAQLYRVFRGNRYIGTYPNGQYYMVQYGKEIIDEMLKNGTIEIKPI